MPLKLETESLLEQGAARQAGDLQLSPLCHISVPSCQVSSMAGLPTAKKPEWEEEGDVCCCYSA